MEISRETDYAVRAVLELASQPLGTRMLSSTVAQRQGIPGAFLTKIMTRLASAGIVNTQRGVGGGVVLARPAEEISLLEVVEAIEGPLTLNRCLRQSVECEHETDCTAHPVWALLRAQLRASMDEVKFSALTRAAAGFTPRVILGQGAEVVLSGPPA